jgi:hypothetical protein
LIIKPKSSTIKSINLQKNDSLSSFFGGRGFFQR